MSRPTFTLASNPLRVFVCYIILLARLIDLTLIVRTVCKYTINYSINKIFFYIFASTVPMSPLNNAHSLGHFSIQGNT